MPTSVHLPVTARPALRVSRSASGADVVVAALTGAEGSATGSKIVGLAPRAVKEAETSLGTDLASLAIRMGGSPKPGSTVILPWKSGSLVLVDAGETAPADEDLRQAAGWGVRAAAELAGDKGVKVAIIDSGIDYTHADFGGPGTQEAYAKANDLDYVVAEPNKRAPNVRPRGYGENFATDRRAPWTH